MGEKENLSLESLCTGMMNLLSYNGEETIVHCDFGHNRSRLVCEFATFAKTGKWIVDNESAGLDGCTSMTKYNLKKGYLPSLKLVEQAIILHYQKIL